MAFFDWIDEGLTNLGIKDEVTDFSNAMKGFVTPIQQGIADVARGGLAANLGEDIGTGLGQIGERIQSYDPLGYLGSNDQSGTPKWQRPWEIAGDTLGELAAPAGQYWQENVAPDILGAGLATIRQAEVPQDELSKYWHESANTLPWGVEGLFEELTNPLNYVGFGLGGKVPLAGRVLGPADRLIGKALSLPIEVPLNLAGKALKATGITALSKAGKAARSIGQVERALSEFGGSGITIDKLQSLLDNPTQTMLSVSDRSIKTVLDNSEVLKSAIATAAKRNKPLVDLVHYAENTLGDVEFANKLRSTELLSDVVKEAYNKGDPALIALADKVKGMVKEGQFENATSQLADPIHFVADDISKLIRKQYGLGGNERNPILRLYGDSTKILKQLWLTTPAFHLANFFDDTTRAILGAGPGVLRGPMGIEDLIRKLGKGDIGLDIGGFTGKTKLGPTGKEGLEKIPVAGKIVEASRKFGEWRESYTRAAIANNYILKELPGLEKSIFSRLSNDLLSAGMEPNSVKAIVRQLNTMKAFSPTDIINLVRKYTPVGDGVIPPSIGDITDLHYGTEFVSKAQQAINNLNPTSATYQQDAVLATQKVIKELSDHMKTASVNYGGKLTPESIADGTYKTIIKSDLLRGWKELEEAFFNDGKPALRSLDGVESILTELLTTLSKYDEDALRLAPMFEDHTPAVIDAFNRKLATLERAKNVISQGLGQEQVLLGLPEDPTVATKMREIFKYLSESTTKAQEFSKINTAERIKTSSRTGSIEAAATSQDYYTKKLATDIKFIQDKLSTSTTSSGISFRNIPTQLSDLDIDGIPTGQRAFTFRNELVTKFKATEDQADATIGIMRAWAKSTGLDLETYMQKKLYPIVGDRGIQSGHYADVHWKAYTDGVKAVISAVENGREFPVVIHELGHVFMEDLSTDESRIVWEHYWKGTSKNVPIEKLKNTIPTEARERFADGFMQYLNRGVSPSSEMIPIFEKFKVWLDAVWEWIRWKKRAELSPEMIKLFDDRLSGIQIPMDEFANKPIIPTRNRPNNVSQAIPSISKVDRSIPRYENGLWNRPDEAIMIGSPSEDIIGRPRYPAVKIILEDGRSINIPPDFIGERVSPLGDITLPTGEKVSLGQINKVVNSRGATIYDASITFGPTETPSNINNQVTKSISSLSDDEVIALGQKIGMTPSYLGTMLQIHIPSDRGSLSLIGEAGEGKIALAYRNALEELQKRSKNYLIKDPSKLPEFERGYTFVNSAKKLEAEFSNIVTPTISNAIPQVNIEQLSKPIVNQPSQTGTSLKVFKQNVVEANAELDRVNQSVAQEFEKTIQVLEQFAKNPQLPTYINNNAQSAVRANAAAGQVAKEWANITSNLTEDARNLINKTAYNYAESLNIDRLLKLVSPFTVWQTRNIPTYMKLLAQHPGMINAMNIYEGESKKQQQGKNMSSRFEGMVQLPGNQGWWIDPRNMISMASQMKEPFVLEGTPGQEGATEFGKNVGSAQKMLGGVGMWPWLQYPMLLTGQQGQMPFPQISPTTRLIQGLTGYNMEQPIQKALETTRANITGTEPPISESMFLDSAINRRLSEWVAEKKITNAQAQRAMDNPNDKIYKDAEVQVRGESDKATLARFMQPFSIKYQGQGEQIIRSLQQELKDRFGGRSYSQLTKQEQNDFNAFKNQNASLRAYDSAFKDPAVRELQIQNDEYWNIGPQWLKDAVNDYSSKSTKAEKSAWIKQNQAAYNMMQTEYWDKRDEYLKTHPDLAKYMNYDRSKEGKATIDSYLSAQKEYNKIPEYRRWRTENPTTAPPPPEYKPTIKEPKAPSEEQIVWNTYYYLKNNGRAKEAAGYLQLNQGKLKTPLKY